MTAGTCAGPGCLAPATWVVSAALSWINVHGLPVCDVHRDALLAAVAVDPGDVAMVPW